MRRRIPSTTALLCFEAAARSGSFSAAAREISLSQSALSRQIQLLEAQVKQSLFKRERQRVTLTAAGRTLWAELSPQLEALEATLLRISAYDSPGGALNLGVYPTLGSRWLMPQLIELAQQRPELTINTITYLSNAEIDPSLVDLAIAQGDPPWPGFRADQLMEESLVVVASPDLLAAPVADADELLSLRILQHATRPKSWAIWFAGIGEALAQDPIGPTFGQFEMLIDAVKAGHGLAVVPRVLVKRELGDGRLILAHPAQVTPPSPYYLLTPTAKVGTPKIEGLRRWLLTRNAPAQRGSDGGGESP